MDTTLAATGVPASNTPPQSNPITPESLQPATLTAFTQPTVPPVPPIPDPNVTPSLEQTPEEQQAQGLTDRLQTLNDQLTGKSADQTAANTTFGVDQAQKTITDLNSQLIGIKNDQAAIPLLLEKANSSQGISQTIIDRQQSSLLRDNAIKALTVSSLMAAAQGQLSNAQSLADKAVAAKYDPIQAEITSKANNLNLILNSPNYTDAEKNRAQAQLDAQKKNQDVLDKQKTESDNINKIALDAATNGADAVTLQKIAGAKTAVEAAQYESDFTTQKANATEAQTAGVKTPAVNRGGVFYDSKTGKVYKDPAEFYKAVGVSSFAEAYAKGLVTDLAPSFAKTGIASYDEWQLYKSQGGTLGYNDYQTMDINRKKSTTGLNTVPVTVSGPKATQYLDLHVGADKKVAPDTWQTALNAWLDDNHTTADFVARFGNYVNKSYTGWENDYAGFGKA